MELLASPRQDFKAGYAGKVQVQQYQSRQGILSAVGEGAVAGQVIDGFDAIDGNIEGIWQTGPLDGKAEEQHVGFLVFNVEDGGVQHDLAMGGVIIGG